MPDTNLIRRIEQEWQEPRGFLGAIRTGEFDPQRANDFLDLLKSIRFPPEASISRRLVSLIWYIPMFLQWQCERVEEHGGSLVQYNQFMNQTLNEVEEILGVP